MRERVNLGRTKDIKRGGRRQKSVKMYVFRAEYIHLLKGVLLHFTIMIEIQCTYVYTVCIYKVYTVYIYKYM